MRTAAGNEPRLNSQEHRKEAIMDSTTQEKAQSRIHRMRWWTLAVVSVTVVLSTIDETILNVWLYRRCNETWERRPRRCSGYSTRTCWSSVACC